jgi:hypothetical protein
LHPLGITGEDRAMAPSDAPPTPSASAARDALAAFAERSPASQADIDQVMRTLAAHEGWYVPVLFADQAWGQTNFDRVLLFPDAVPRRVLNVFTDETAALLADGQEIGVYGGPVSGVQLLRALGPDIEALVVNFASPREHQWFIASGGFDIAINWASAIGVERALARRGSGPAPAAELLGHRFHLLLDRQTDGPAQIQLPDIDGSVAVCFTALDRAEEFVASLPAAARPLADLSAVSGPTLFDKLHSVGAAGLVLNAGSDDQTALTRDDIAEITGLRAARL